MKLQKVTKDALRNMDIGERKVFSYTDYKALRSASQLCYMVGRENGCYYGYHDNGDNTMTISRKRKKPTL